MEGQGIFHGMISHSWESSLHRTNVERVWLTLQPLCPTFSLENIEGCSSWDISQYFCQPGQGLESNHPVFELSALQTQHGISQGPSCFFHLTTSPIKIGIFHIKHLKTPKTWQLQQPFGICAWWDKSTREERILQSHPSPPGGSQPWFNAREC